ncbi:MAG: 4-(cytidine 5'-diphospho)-2-C-methyl-D-erythritol kinase [Clostridia bacterium]|nr:4-(cytidine 5'-diphospho)-2-C-methyl-D-erythritol kinase [Clostridia bacterium]
MKKSLKIKCPAKINLSLDVVNRREDGYHNLEMIMHTVKLFDILDISFESVPENKLTISTDSGFIPTDDRNLCAKATRLFLEKANITGKVEICIKKNIPVGAGLGGGSSDAAGTLLALNKLTLNPLSSKELSNLAAKIGADVPFFLYGGCMLATGIGEILSPLPTLKNVTILIAKPKYGISTPFVYKNLLLDEKTPHPDTKSVIEGIKTGNLELIAKSCKNVLETVVVDKYPEINQYKEIMKKHGAVYSLMSGSGSSVFGVFMDKVLAGSAAKELKKLTRQVYLA